MQRKDGVKEVEEKKAPKGGRRLAAAQKDRVFRETKENPKVWSQRQQVSRNLKRTLATSGLHVHRGGGKKLA